MKGANTALSVSVRVIRGEEVEGVEVSTSATAPKLYPLGSSVPLLQLCENGAVCSEESAFSGTILQRREPIG